MNEKDATESVMMKHAEEVLRPFGFNTHLFAERTLGFYLSGRLVVLNWNTHTSCYLFKTLFLVRLDKCNMQKMIQFFDNQRMWHEYDEYSYDNHTISVACSTSTFKHPRFNMIRVDDLSTEWKLFCTLNRLISFFDQLGRHVEDERIVCCFEQWPVFFNTFHKYYIASRMAFLNLSLRAHSCQSELAQLSIGEQYTIKMEWMKSYSVIKRIDYEHYEMSLRIFYADKAETCINCGVYDNRQIADYAIIRPKLRIAYVKQLVQMSKLAIE